MSTSSRSAQAVLVLMVAVVLVLVTGPTMVDADWCPRTGDSCGPAWWCCECDPNTGRKLSCGLTVSGYKCGTYAFEPGCDSGKGCSADGVCKPYDTLEETVREALGLPRKLSMNK
jgi:hypothetical protein